MQGVITSRLEDVGHATDGVMTYQLTNGLRWAGSEDDPEVSCDRMPWVTLYHDDGRFFLAVEGLDEPVEVTLIACRRRVWEPMRRRPMLLETC